MKVLYVINGLGTGGAERSLAEMLPMLVERGVEPTVVCLYRRQEGVERSVIDAGIPVRFIDGTSLPMRVAQLRRLLKQHRPDLVHTTIFESDLVGRLACAGTGIPVLTSLVNTSYDPVRLQDPNVNARRLRAVQLLDGWTARHLTAHFHAITHAVKDSAVRDLGIPAEAVTVVERGRDAGRLGAPSPDRRARSRLRLGLEPAADVVVAAGRQEYQKGHRYLFEALPALQGEHPRLVVLMAGRTGHSTPELTRLHAELPAPERVRFLGHRDDLPDVLAAADVFVFPSLYEGLGGVVIEAMALGLPIVASDLPTLREVLGPDTAEFAPVASPYDLAHSIDTLLNDSERRTRYGQDSATRFTEMFNLPRSADRVVSLYSRVTASGNGRGRPLRRQSPTDPRGLARNRNDPTLSSVGEAPLGGAQC